MDTTALVSAVPSTAIVAGITALAAVKFAPVAIAWGYNRVMRMLGR